jgi:hypothetical protein
METKNIDINVKTFPKKEMQANSDTILKARELLVETEGEGDELVARFKIGDGKTPYSQLKYIATLYDLFPNFKLCNKDYSLALNINLKGE